jgi:cellulose synthase/poly-beta-1,6-N-acetylglucosamine synthase-like glycosyltransferase
VLWFWFFVGPALALAFLSLFGERKRAAYVARRISEQPAHLPPASVLVPVKGEDDGLRENLNALASLDYTDYELIVVARRAADIPPGVLPSRVRVVLAHGTDDGASEKVQNLAAAVRATRKSSEVFAFADSDGRPAKGWLRALVAPLAEPGVGASSGYRWHTPDPPAFWPLMRSVWNAVIAGTLVPGDNRWAWGGATAIRKDTFFEIGVLEFWKNTVSDDYALSAAVHKAGLTIAWAPGATTPSPGHTTAGEFLSWIRRQLILTRIYNPRQWWLALVAHFFYCGGMAAAVLASIKGNRLAEWLFIAQISPGMLKGANRAALAKAALPEWKRWFDRYGWVHSWFVPLATWIWLYALVASAFGRTITWRGRRYRVDDLDTPTGPAAPERV